MVVFALSCFGILLFLWLQFGGPIPLKPEGYRVKVAFPEAIGAGRRGRRARPPASRSARSARRGRRRPQTARWPRSSSTREYAPLPSDARAILRRKTLLGETFVEITTGTRAGARCRTAGGWPTPAWRRPSSSTRSSTYDPRHAPRVPGLAAGAGLGGRRPRRDLNNALGHAARLHRDGRRPARGARRAGGRGARPRARHRRGLRGADPGRGAAAALIRSSERVFRSTGSRDDASPRRSTSSRRSSTSRRRRSSGSRPSRATRGRWCATCARWRASCGPP